MSTHLRGAFGTGCGMLALWSQPHFQGITDHETWERELLEDRDIGRQMRAGAFVPLDIHSDGLFECEVRVGDLLSPEIISPREKQYLFAAAEPYLFRSQGEACLSGIEEIEREPSESVGRLSLTPGDYAAAVHLLDWDKEPGVWGENGRPVASALPEFLVLLNPASGQESFRAKVESLDEPRFRNL